MTNRTGKGRHAAFFGVSALAVMIGTGGALAAPLTAINDPVRLLTPTAAVTFDIAQVETVTMSPYRWSAQKSADGGIVIKGYAPDAGIQETLLTAAGAQALDASSLASGAPEGFASHAEAAIAILKDLSEGQVTLLDDAWWLIGKTEDPEAAARISATIESAALTGENWQVDLELPEFAAAEASEVPAAAEPAPLPFSFAARKHGDSWLLGGNAPVAPFQTYLESHFGIETGGELHVAAAPADFAEAALKGMEALKALTDGRLMYDGSGWTLSGVAADDAAADAVRTVLADSGIVAEISVTPEVVASEPTVAEEAPAAAPEVAALPMIQIHPYRWSVMRLEDGLDFAGYVPSDALMRYLDVKKGQGGSDEALQVAGGAPEGFAADVLVALDAVEQLLEGEVSLQDDTWMVSGIVASNGDKSALEALLGARAGSWALDLAVLPGETEMAEAAEEPAPVEEAEPVAAPEPIVEPLPLPSVHPFRWSVSVAEHGGLDFAGYVPNDGLKRYLGVKAGVDGEDETVVAAGAPDGFAEDVFAGLGAVPALEDGSLEYDGDAWVLRGSVGSAEQKEALIASLGPRASSWTLDITAPEPEPVVDRGAADFSFAATKAEDGSFALSGGIPAEATRAYLGMLAGTDAIAALGVRDGAPPQFVLDMAAGMRALKALDSGQLTYGDFAWSLAGKGFAEASRASARQELAALPDAADWGIAIEEPTPLEICTVAVAAFDERNAILFDPGSSRITRDSDPALEEIAGTLKLCPETVVHVEGHTDADGDEESNLILSVSRAEAVIDRLVSLGVGDDRLYAIGYGESLPIASNDTNDGKRRNRRIVFAVADSGDGFE